jgi:hypothetical protein
VIADEPTLVTPRLTRRERRIERGRARRRGVLAGWLGYGVSVLAVIVVAAWLAVRGGVAVQPSAPAGGSKTTSTRPAAALRPVTPSTAGGQSRTVSVPATTPETTTTVAAETPTTVPIAPTTTTPVVSAVATPTP